jgi:hypothetical protein
MTEGNSDCRYSLPTRAREMDTETLDPLSRAMDGHESTARWLLILLLFGASSPVPPYPPFG